MNFLELCQRAFQEAAVSGVLSTAQSQVGENKRIVDWVADACDEICRRHEQWKFLRSSFTVNTTAGLPNYLPNNCTDSRSNTGITIDQFAVWKVDTFRIYLASAGIATQAYLPPTRDYDVFRDRWLFGSPGNSRPSTFSIRPDDDSIMLGATPDAVYTITGDYQRTQPRLTADADVPLVPTKYQMAIVWQAVRTYAGYEEDGGTYDHANREYNRINSDLELRELPEMMMAGPLV